MDERVLRTAERHLRKADPVMAGLIARFGPLTPESTNPPPLFHILVRVIVNQQLSAKAGATIGGRLLALQAKPFHEAEALLRFDPEAIRHCGLSRSKVRFIRTLAEAVANGVLNLDQLAEHDDEIVSNTLSRYPGLGRWSIDVFLMFGLGRPDVFPVGDVSLRRAMRRLFELPQDAELEAYAAVAKPWRPYRTVACRYLWMAGRES